MPTEREVEAEAMANDLLQFKTSGLCVLGEVCTLCDCFATKEFVKGEKIALIDHMLYLLEQQEKRHAAN